MTMTTREALKTIRAAFGDPRGEIHAPPAVRELLEQPGFGHYEVGLVPASDSYKRGQRVRATSYLVGVFEITDTRTGKTYPLKPVRR
jgi:hypothetical protein